MFFLSILYLYWESFTLNFKDEKKKSLHLHEGRKREFKLSYFEQENSCRLTSRIHASQCFRRRRYFPLTCQLTLT